MLAATQTSARASDLSKKKRQRGPSGSSSRGTMSYFWLPPTFTRSTGAPLWPDNAGASVRPGRARHRASAARCRKTIFAFGSGSRSGPEIRPFTITRKAHPARFASRNRFGQISVSRMTTSDGCCTRGTHGRRRRRYRSAHRRLRRQCPAQLFLRGCVARQRGRGQKKGARGKFSPQPSHPALTSRKHLAD